MKEERSLKLGAGLIPIARPQGACAPGGGGAESAQTPGLQSDVWVPRPSSQPLSPAPCGALCSQEGPHSGALVCCSNFLGLSVFTVGSHVPVKKAAV